MKMDLKGIGCDGVHWNELLQVRVLCQALVNMIMKQAIHKRGNILTT
jgi:hypothetical protein